MIAGQVWNGGIDRFANRSRVLGSLEPVAMMAP